MVGASAMKILLTGATGFIGGHIARALRAAGHEVSAATRANGVDFNQMQTADAWRPHLQGIDAVINSVGIIAEVGRQRFPALHRDAPIALFQACTQAGVGRVIQISALGADEHAFTPYQLTKKAADDALRDMDLDWFVLRPSLVYGSGGSSTAMFRMLATLPVMPLVGQGTQRVQPVHVDDVAAAVMACLTASPARRTIDVVGPQAFTFAEWLQRLRRHGGRSTAMTVAIPFGLVLASSYVIRYVAPILHPDNLRMLRHGNTSDVQPLAQLLGRMPRGVP